ncbi:MAG TPA: fibronectin type III domain-containing protein, partial [Flavitalea sp.]|nr:fibronectin type III domain-containing protein [Flavitalea sp.]
MKKFILILIASIGISFYLSAQSAGDYRSIGSGNWNDATKWQRYNGSNWISTTTYPGQNPGTGGVTIMTETEIKVTETVPHPVTALFVSIDDPNIVPTGLTFSAENAVSLIVSGDVYITGELKIDNQNGAKTHELFIGGNFRNYGGFQTTNQDDKLGVTFNSTASCLIVSNSGLNVHDITFNCAGTLLVYTSIFITGTATFINGIVRPMEKDATNGSDLYSDYDILFGDGSTVSGGSNASFIIGRVCKYGVGPFTFPTGHEGFYAPLTISAIDQPEWICAGYSRNNGDWAQAPITDPELFSVNPCDLWSVYRYFYDFIINTSIDVTVGWTSPTPCGSFYIANVSDIVLANFDGSTWNSHAGTSTGTTTNGSVTWSGYNFPGSFSLGNVGTDCRTPSGLNSTNITTNSATVSWSALPGAVSYDVEYSTGGGSWINAATATLSTSVNLTGLNPGTTYDAIVRANCGSGSSSYRMTKFTTANDCGLPPGLSTTNITHNSATLNWGAATNALNYDVEYKRSPDISWLTAVTGTTSLTYNLNGLIASTEYNWRVKANCNVGAGNYAQSSFTTQTPVCN